MTDPTIDSVRRHAIPVDLDTGLNRVVDLIGDARLVLLGEASHGTHEFYRARADITRELITHHGFNLIAVEADWPDAHRAHRWNPTFRQRCDCRRGARGLHPVPQMDVAQHGRR